MQTIDFDFVLPQERIALSPAAPRDHSKLMFISRKEETIVHYTFHELPSLIPAGAILVRNITKVQRARLSGIFPTGSSWEIFFLEEKGSRGGIFFVSPGKKFPEGALITLQMKSGKELKIQVRKIFEDGRRELLFLNSDTPIRKLFQEHGAVPLPPYIAKHIKDNNNYDAQYQTTYAEHEGSVAAPTAGLHFIERTFSDLASKGVDIVDITLHVGAGTFLPVKVDNPLEHRMHEESYEVSEESWEKIMEGKKQGRPIIAVGTTTTRVLEHCAKGNALKGSTDIFIYPPYQFQLVDGLITNFHLPKSTLLMLVSAFAENAPFPGKIYPDGRTFVLDAYQKAIEKNYRFYSFGDAMFIM